MEFQASKVFQAAAAGRTVFRVLKVLAYQAGKSKEAQDGEAEEKARN